ncbi:CHASE2 domain-containing protein [Phormidium tenue FACHB-886]|nr:CHASE2 domain-containing protein [Phormidium tenue FACHB-886]
MSKRVTLKLDGDFEQHGFRVTLEISPADLTQPSAYPYSTELIGNLPPAPDLIAHLDQWQQTYRKLIFPSRAIKPHRVTYGGSISPIDACRRSAQELESHLQTWLKAEPFQEVNVRLREELSKQEAIQVLIRSPDRRLSQLPWHRWDFIERYPQAEIAFSTPDFEQIAVQPPPPTPKVRILGILGNSANIDIAADRQLLASLPDAEVTFLVEPQRQQINDHLWEQAWDILFFAGHSDSNDDAGQIYINPHDSLSIDNLRYGLKRAIASGLQLAIFNSCDGLSLARSLADLRIPHLVVMREPVPDLVAQHFLRYFLPAFASGKSFYLAVREARERLQGLEDQFPCASWLPVIYQSPAAQPLTWQACQKPQSRRQTAVVRQPLFTGNAGRVAIGFSGLAALVVVLARLVGLLQPWELQAYDQLMQMRPEQGQDDRFLLVTITEADVAAQSSNARRGASLTDADLEKLLQRLQSYQPRVIALDLYRDFAASPNHPALTQFLQTDDRLIGVCSFGKTQSNLGIAPPPEIPNDQIRNRVGFSSTVTDPDDRLRRQLLMQTPAAQSVCPSDLSLGLLIALRYLRDEGVSLEWTNQEKPQIKIGNRLFSPLEQGMGGYQQIDDRGHQILLNYRATKAGIARAVTLSQVLNGQIDPAWVKDRIVMIGNTDTSFKDFHLTPISSEKIPGLVIQAHMASQILSAVLDGRPLLQTSSAAAEIFWISGWAIGGSIIVWRWRSRRSRLIATVGAIGLLVGGCYLLLLQGYWLPLVPAVLALGGTIIVYIVFETTDT